jgi:hypothetical protein
MRASLNKDGQNLLTKHFLASPHVCDTIEGLILAYYELLYKRLYKIYKRLVVSIVLHLTTLSSTSVMECLHGKTTSYNLLEEIYAKFIGFFVCLQNYSEESIRHKNQDIYQNRTKQLLIPGCQRRCYGQYLHVVQHYIANLLHTYILLQDDRVRS